MASVLTLCALGLWTSAGATTGQAATAHTCKDVVIRVGNGVVYTRTEKLVAWKIGCRKARRVVRAFLTGAEGAETRPKPFGFRCKSSQPGGRCEKGKAIVWWSYDTNRSNIRL